MDLLKILFDKSIYEINLLQSRSTFKSYSSISNYKQHLTNEIILNDGWQGKFLKTIPKDIDLLLRELDSCGLDDVVVPLSLELQGYDQIKYVNTQYEFDGYDSTSLGETLKINNPCYIYQRNFELSELTERDKYIINFKGFESGLFLYINDRFVGYSENLYLDSEFDITPFLKVGSNKINAIVAKYSSSTWLLNQDFFRFMGIFRDVSISKYHKNHIFDIDIKTKNNGKTYIELSGDIQNLKKEIEIISPTNEIVYKTSTSLNNFEFILENVMLWDAENPNIYTAIIKTYLEDELIEIVEEKYGYKEVKIENGVLFFNDKRLKLFGINRHEWNCRRGRNVSLDDMMFDVKFLKSYNVNAIRTSHYPNHATFYELADQYGFYIMDEACLETHSSLTTYNTIGYDTQIPGDNHEWDIICVNKIKRMYLRDKNHPSIFMYSLGNESGYGEVLQKMYSTLKELNPDALIHYEWCCRVKGQEVCSDVFSQMYAPANKIDNLLSSYEEKPYLICEYAHAMGNSLGAIDKYVSLLDKYENYHGGFIWDYIDQALYMKNENQEEVLCYGGDFLDKPNDHDFCCNGVIFADRKDAYKSPKAIEMKYQYQQFTFLLVDNKLTITNNYLFTNANKFNFAFTVYKNSSILCTFDKKLDICPGESENVELDSSMFSLDGEIILDIKVLDNENVVAYQHFIISDTPTEHKKEKYKLNVIDGRYNIGVKVGNLDLLFAKSSFSFFLGGLISLKVNNEEYLMNEILPTIFRPTTNNDFANYFMYDNNFLLSYSKYLRLDYKSTRYEYDEERFIIKFKYLLDHRNETGIWIKYTIKNSAEIIIDVNYEKLQDVSELAMLGIRFELLKNKNKVHYCGLSGETYPDRKAGGIYGIHDLNVEDGYTNYMTPQECGNHEDTRWLILEGVNSNLKIEYIRNLFKFKFMEYSDFAIEQASHFEELAKTRKNYLTIMGYTRGVGGDNTWGAKVHQEYCIENENLCFSFKLYETNKGDR